MMLWWTRQKRILGRLQTKRGASVDDDQFVADNLLKLSVFYEHLRRKDIEESPAYTVSVQRTLIAFDDSAL